MQLRIIEQDEEKLLLEVKGEDWTLLSLIKEEAWKDPRVKEVAIVKEHPYLAEPKLRLIAKEPFEVLMDAARRVQKKALEFCDEFEKALKG